MKRYILAAALACLNLVHAQPPPDEYKCNTETFKCEKCDPVIPACALQRVCEANCGHKTPIDLRGTWRGFMVKDHAPSKHTAGEFSMFFDSDSYTYKRPDGTTSKGSVSITQGGTVILVEKNSTQSVMVVYSEVAWLKHTHVVGMSTYMNASYPDSFLSGIKSNDTMSMALFVCNDAATEDQCLFEESKLKTLAAQSNEKKIQKVEDDCGLCDKASEMCYQCDCQTGGGCLPVDQCKKGCGPHGPMYSCSWNTTHPTCVLDPNSKTDLNKCQEGCAPAQYGKCDFSTNTCAKCTHGPDPDCIYLMTYCNAAQKEGRCKQEVLGGSYRMIDAHPGYESGEYDVSFKDGKITFSDLKNSYSADVNVTGAGEGGSVAFEVLGWRPGPVWPNPKMYGVFEESRGEKNIFSFLQLAILDQPITKLEDGLMGRFFTGFSCNDKSICQTSAPSSLPKGQTPAPKFSNFFLQ